VPDPDKQPQFIKDFIAAFTASNPDVKPPIIWDQRNGWCAVRMPDQVREERSVRKSQLIRMTEAMRKVPN
jgi:hypothetical protein